MESSDRKFAIGSLVATLIAVIALQALLFGPHAETLSYSEFKVLVRNGKVSDLVFDRQTITGTVAVEGLQGLLFHETLDAKRGTLEALAKRLIEKEVVDRAALTQLIADTDGRSRGAGQDEGGRASPTRSGATSPPPREAPVDA